jgi:hypothetical protein
MTSCRWKRSSHCLAPIGSLTLLLLASCGGNKFGSASKPSELSKDGEKPNPSSKPSDQDGVPKCDGEKGICTLSKELAAEKPQPVDQLFVLDDSGSMLAPSADLPAGIIGAVTSGLKALPLDKFPPNSRVAVMYTIPADPADLTRLHPSVTASMEPVYKYSASPGFLRFVSRNSVDNFVATSFPALKASIASAVGAPRAKLETHLASWEKDFKPESDFCDSSEGWYTPDQKNGKGESCFHKALTIPSLGVGCEAGLVAVRQLVQKMGATSPFRKGAVVNVTFVSDTQDPGCPEPRVLPPEPNKALTALRIPGADLAKEIVTSSGAEQVRFNAIAPSKEAAGIAEKLLSSSYVDAVKATGGQFLDLSTSPKDYSPVLTQILLKPKLYSVVMPVDVTSVDSVKVDGQVVTDFKIEPGVLQLNLPPSEKARKVEVVWKSAAAK